MFRFKLKYHPEDATKRKEECKASLEKRIDVFIKFMDELKFNQISIDGDQSDTLIKLLDSVVIYLEGGSELDLQVNIFLNSSPLFDEVLFKKIHF